MAQKLANLTGTVILVGREDSIKKVYRDLRNPARNKINKRTDKPYTTFGVPELGEGRTHKGTRRPKLTFTFERPQILGNWESDVDRHITRSIARCNVDVEAKVYDVDRNEV